jgi:type II secretory ATPase GspE/PulE/Tfp pilus assembly ATPase PilB-like protein
MSLLLDEKVKNYLLQHQIISVDLLSIAQEECHFRQISLIQALMNLNFVPSQNLTEILTGFHGYPSVDLSKESIVLDQPLGAIWRDLEALQAFPFRWDQQEIHIAFSDPLNPVFPETLPRLFPQKRIVYYQGDSNQIAQYLLWHRPQPTWEQLEVQDWIQEILIQAVQKGASDIHIFPDGSLGWVRLRIHGLLRPLFPIHPSRLLSIGIRLKILSELDIGETRLPQNGHFHQSIGKQLYDFRVSFHPTVGGESIVIRVLNRELYAMGLDNLGFFPEQVEQLRQLVQKPQGLILVSGPTGSGKTTTLYALMQEINGKERHLITLEEPIELHWPGIRQTPIAEKGPLSFSVGLRSILRHDPDVILIGEIRDSETAQMAVRASLTGHLVLATIHARDLSSIPGRLIDLGADPALLADQITALISQNLRMVPCGSCRSSSGPLSGIPCSFCFGGGNRRQVQAQIVLLSSEMRQAIAQQNWNQLQERLPSTFSPSHSPLGDLPNPI